MKILRVGDPVLVYPMQGDFVIMHVEPRRAIVESIMVADSLAATLKDEGTRVTEIEWDRVRNSGPNSTEVVSMTYDETYWAFGFQVVPAE